MQRHWRLLVAVVVIACLVVFARGVQWSETWHAVRGASAPMLVAAALVNMASLVLKAVRWWIFLAPVGVASPWLALRATFAGAAINNIVVANAGEAARVMMVSRASGVSSDKVLATLALERLFEFAGYVMMLAAAVSLLRLPPALHDMRVVAFLVLGALMALLVYLTRHPERIETPPAAQTGFSVRVATYGRGFMQALRAVSTPRRFIGSLLIATVVWALQVATYHMTARAAHVDVPLVGTIAAILAVNLGFAVRATPGNVGVFQAMYALTVAAFGVDGDAALGVAMLIQAQQILPVTALGLLASPDLVRRARVSRA